MATKHKEVRNCSATQYEFDLSAGTKGKLILRDFNRVYYSLKMPQPSKPKPTSGYERKYQKLSPEQRNAVLDDLKEYLKLEKQLKEKPTTVQ
jgi:hypothetical protein